MSECSCFFLTRKLLVESLSYLSITASLVAFVACIIAAKWVQKRLNGRVTSHLPTDQTEYWVKHLLCVCLSEDSEVWWFEVQYVLHNTHGDENYFAFNSSCANMHCRQKWVYLIITLRAVLAEVFIILCFWNIVMYQKLLMMLCCLL